tara:strand:- start:514 stop:735 length:222 start_codon:yes stop_codon:yes gene_type:complete
MITKASQLRKMMSEGDWHGALRMAARFPKLGQHKEAIQLGWSALTNPSFYKQIHKNPDDLIQAGITALKERYI